MGQEDVDAGTGGAAAGSLGQGGDGVALEGLDSLLRAVEQAGASVPGSPRCVRPLRWRGTEIGGTQPVVAVATTGSSPEVAARQAVEAAQAGADLVELRLDLLDLDAGDSPQGWGAAAGAVEDALRESGYDLPLLLTLRTQTEGGGARLSDDAYRLALLGLVEALRAHRQAGGAQTVCALDVELARGVLPEVVSAARGAGLDVVGSSHDFAATPACAEVCERLAQMEEQGAAVAKIAVTPTCHEDVVTLLTATAQARAESELPLVTMSMGALGAVTRLAGSVFGSAVTFATAGGAPSAPGQPGIGALREAQRQLERRRDRVAW